MGVFRYRSGGIATGLFLTLPLHGHMTPALPLVGELVARGDTVACCSTGEFEEAVAFAYNAPMAITARRVHHTYEEYVALEDASTVRHEYLDGEIYAMAGGSPDPAALAATVIALLRSQLPPTCRVFTSDFRIRVAATGLSTYPDAAVVCGPTARAADDRLAVTNPVLLVEVTSSSTEEYDRGEKLRHYMQLPSLREVVIVSHRAPAITVHRRQGEGWMASDARPGEVVSLAAISGSLAVDDVYRDGLEDVDGEPSRR
jgi:Uma2 family endonuclease